MRAFLAALTFCLLVNTASAHGRYHHHVHPMVRGLGSGLVHMLDTKGHRHGNHLRHYAGHLDGNCGHAARLGGPCGCWASEHFFGRSIEALWTAASWLVKFPHTFAHAGTAAVWPNRHHVAPVIAVNGDGTVTVRDSWATHRVRMAGLTFVQP